MSEYQRKPVGHAGNLHHGQEPEHVTMRYPSDDGGMEPATGDEEHMTLRYPSDDGATLPSTQEPEHVTMRYPSDDGGQLPTQDPGWETDRTQRMPEDGAAPPGQGPGFMEGINPSDMTMAIGVESGGGLPDISPAVDWVREQLSGFNPMDMTLAMIMGGEGGLAEPEAAPLMGETSTVTLSSD